MISIEDLLAKIASDFDVKPARRGDGWEIQLPRRGYLLCELAIGPEALEWYATVRGVDTLPKWEGWMDYRGYGDESSSALLNEKSGDILCFVEHWCRASGIRVVESRKMLGLVRSRALETKRDDQWHELSMSSQKKS